MEITTNRDTKIKIKSQIQHGRERCQDLKKGWSIASLAVSLSWWS